MSAVAVNEQLERAVRLRPDIEWSEFSRGKRPTWVARDPISLDYFYFSELEYSITRLLDGHHTAAEILRLRGGDAVTRDWLLTLINKLEGACLTSSEVTRSARYLWHTRGRRRQGTFLRQLLSPLAIRIKLFDPTWLLNLLAPVARILFSKLFVVVWLTTLIIVGSSVFLRWLQSPTSLVDALDGLTAQRALLLGVIYVMVKSLHELGHALACKKWGAECHEIGLMFLVFMPCLYCDTSDSWKLPSRLRRAFIAAAGIYVELSLAAIAGLVWLFSTPDTELHLLAANVMIIGSLSTVLVNANPLLRYDGYYMLSDLWGVPNLHEQSREASRAMATAWLTGRRLPKDRWDASPCVLTVYGIAAWFYRHFVVIMIAFLVWTLLDEIGLNLVGAFLVILTVASALVASALGAIQWTKELLMVGGIRTLRSGLVCVVFIISIVTFFNKAWPTYVSSRAVARLADLTPVYAEHSGRLVSFRLPGQSVAPGSNVVQIASPELDLELIDARGQVAFFEQRANQLRSRLVDDDTAATELATVIEELSKAQDRLRILELESQSLIARASQAGVLLAGEQRQQQAFTALPDVQDSSPLLSPENTGCYVERGTLLGWLNHSTELEVIAYVIEADAEILNVGMPVVCRWDCEASQAVRGTILRIAPEPIAEIPESLMGDQSIPYQVGKHGKLLPETPHYEVRVSFENLPTSLSHQSLGTVHFETSPRTWYQSLRRYLDQNVRADL
ncbi:MAG: hypothetical protein R3C53_20105 [Pirellulaceae bacterium]